MTNKLSFAIQDARVVDNYKGNSNFAIVEIDAFATGNNAHNLYISEDALKRAAPSLLLKPLTYAMSNWNKDFMGHETVQFIAGFVPHDSPLEFVETNGRLVLKCVALVWKKYVENFLEVFRRNPENKKSVSVEMDVLEMTEKAGTKGEIVNFSFNGITCLGENIRPAIPGANALVLSFSDEQKEFDKIYEIEFSSRYGELDFTIPESVKKNCSYGLENYKQFGATPLILSIARHLKNNTVASPEKVRLLVKKLSRYTNLESDEDKIKYSLYGGKEAFEWGKQLVDQMDKIDSRRMAYFGEVGNMNDNSNSAENQNFGLNEGGKEEMSMPNEELKEQEEKFETPEEEKKEPEAEEKTETPEEEKKEETPSEEKMAEEVEEKEEPKEEVKMGLDAYLDMVNTLRLLEEVTEGEEEDDMSMACKMAADEMKKEGEKDFGVVMKGLYAKMCKMSAKMTKMSEDAKVYLSENEELKKFKTGIEGQRFVYEVEQTLKEVENSMPSDEIQKSREESKSFSLENIDAWKNSVKAKAFTFSSKSKKTEKTSEIPRWGIFDNIKKSKDDILWTVNK